MTKNDEKLKNLGFEFETMDDLLLYVSAMIDWLEHHNKNYTKEQYYHIITLQEIMDCLE